MIIIRNIKNLAKLINLTRKHNYMVLFASFAAVIAFVLLMAYLGYLFVLPIFELFINGIILYSIFLRSEVEITKEKKSYFYLGGATAAIIIYVISGNFLKNLHMWSATTFIIIAFICSQIGIYGHKLHIKKNNSKAQKVL